MIQRLIVLLLLGFAACFSESDPLPIGSSSESSGAPVTGSSEVSGSSQGDSSSTTAIADSSSTGSVDDSSSSTSEVDGSSSTTEAVVSDWAVYFGGDGSMASDEPIDLALSGDFTVEAWARVDSADAVGTAVAHRGAGTTGWSLGFDTSSSEIVFGNYDNNGEWHEVHGVDAAALDPGWHHIAGVKQGSSLWIFVDGALDSTATTAQAMSAPVVPVVLGDGTDHGPLFGIALDDVQISTIARYTAAFTPDEELFGDGFTAVLLPFDEGDGAVALDTSEGVVFQIMQGVWTPGNTR